MEIEIIGIYFANRPIHVNLEFISALTLFIRESVDFTR